MPFADEYDGDLFLFDLDTAELTRITDDDDGHDRWPHFSGDGEWIYWRRSVYEGEGMEWESTDSLVRIHSNLLDPFETVIGDGVPGRIEVAWPQASW